MEIERTEVGVNVHGGGELRADTIVSTLLLFPLFYYYI